MYISKPSSKLCFAYTTLLYSHPQLSESGQHPFFSDRMDCFINFGISMFYYYAFMFLFFLFGIISVAYISSLGSALAVVYHAYRVLLVQGISKVFLFIPFEFFTSPDFLNYRKVLLIVFHENSIISVKLLLLLIALFIVPQHTLWSLELFEVLAVGASGGKTSSTRKSRNDHIHLGEVEWNK